MDLPTVQAADLLQTNNFDWVGAIYTGSIPPEVQKNTDSNIILITEYVNEPIFYANADFKGWRIGVQLSIFYKLKIDFNIQDAEIEVAKLFKRANWTIEKSKDHIKDPDTNQISKVFYFVKNEVLREAK